ncbi:MAG: glycogen-branching enzyme [Clostridiales Family XIII bacterium]|nr:glycogen-branching enzyme [Clostridiales Family XIII bacterium]
MDLQQFYEGKSFDTYEYLGAHFVQDGVVFRTYAPNARQISLVTNFNNWEEIPLIKTLDGNFWEVFVQGAHRDQLYKFRIYSDDTHYVDHSDPYGYHMEVRPFNCSVVYGLDDYFFHDAHWLDQRTDCKDKPLNIYELHMGSWRKPSEKQDDWYTYRQVADMLVPYVKEMGYNYIEVLPLSEHPSDESWGYQNTGFFSPTSRYGWPADLKYFIDICHRHNIGVIMDFVPVHFAIDDFALKNYDGTPLYEHRDPSVGVSEWGSYNFWHERGDVRSFLLSAANYWIHEYHFDGIRIDAVNNLIYWQGNSDRGENRFAIQFLRDLNSGLKEMHPGVILAAEDSSIYGGVTKPVDEGGLGFDYKWAIGWMNDTLNYFKTPPEKRAIHRGKLTYTMDYFYSENFLLPLSHDEVVHGKASIAQKMYRAPSSHSRDDSQPHEIRSSNEDGNPQNLRSPQIEKLAHARTLYLYMYTHPGKKLSFMGNELATFAEWDAKSALPWELLSNPSHGQFHRFMHDLNHVYLHHCALWEDDYARNGFRWLQTRVAKCSDDSESERQSIDAIFAYERVSANQRVVTVLNLSNQFMEGLQVEISDATSLDLIIATDDVIYGGDWHYHHKQEAVMDGFVILDFGAYSGRCYATK